MIIFNKLKNTIWRVISSYSVVFTVLLYLITNLYCPTCLAQIQEKEVITEYTYTMGDRDSYIKAVEIATNRAKNLALDEVGMIISSLTVVDMGCLRQDDIVALAGGFISTKVIHKERQGNKVYVKILANVRIDENKLRQLAEKYLSRRIAENTKYIRLENDENILIKPFKHKFGLYPNEVLDKLQRSGCRLPTLKELEDVVNQLEFAGEELCTIDNIIYECKKGSNDKLMPDFNNDRKRYRCFRWVIAEFPKSD